MAKRAAAGTLALAVCLTGGAIGAGAANAAAGFAFDNRVAGPDRIGTAVEASKRAFPTTANTVIVVNDEATVDGLTASYAAGLNDAPILYVKRDSIPAETAAEITRLGATKIIIVGGTSVVSSGVQSSLGGNNKTVTRLSGSDRYATAAAVATSGTAKPGKLFIANGEAPADALAAGPIAFAKKYPVLLTEAADVPASTSAALNTLAVDTRVVLGGNVVVSTTTYDDLKGTQRLGGANRQATAVQVAGFATGTEGFAGVNLGLVGPEDRNTADALIASPLLAKQQAPLLFTARGAISVETGDYLKANAAKLTGEGYVFGGEVAVPSSIAAEGTAAAGGTGTTPTPGAGNQRIAVTPNTTENKTLAEDEVVAGDVSQADADVDNRTFTASGLQNGRTYRITLVDSRNIAVDNAGVVSFKAGNDTNSRTGFSADVGEDDADIVRVNGDLLAPAAFGTDPAVQTAARTITATPVNGTITFEIDGTSVGDVTPVVYFNGGTNIADADGGTSARLELTANRVGQFSVPTEPFGLGGKTTFVGEQAPNGAIVAANIASVDKASNSFTTDPVTAPATAALQYKYDENDEFTVNGEANRTLAQFEEALSSGDDLTAGTYRRNVAEVSTFTITNSNPSPPATPTLSRGTGASQNDITLASETVDAAVDIDQFLIERAPVTLNSGGGETVGAFAIIATIAAGDEAPGTPNTQFSYVDNDLPAGSYRYRVAAVNDGDTGPRSGQSDRVTVTSSDSIAPTIVDTRVANNPGPVAPATTPTVGDLEPGDSFKVVASERFAPPETGVGGSRLSLRDTDRTVVDLGNGINGTTFTLNPSPESVGGVEYGAGRVLTVTIGTFTASTPGSVPGLQIPADIVDSNSNTDVGGNEILLTNADITIDNQ